MKPQRTKFACKICSIKMTRNEWLKRSRHLLCKIHYREYLKNYCRKTYIKGTMRHKAFCFNRNRAGAKIKVADLDAIMKLQFNKCKICGNNLQNERWEIDHIIPMASGGKHNLSNLQIICRHCNRGKWDLSLSEYISHCIKVAAFQKSQEGEGRNPPGS